MHAAFLIDEDVYAVTTYANVCLLACLQGVDWNVPKPGGGVNDYMEILVKETVTLHKVLSRYLSTPVVEVSSRLTTFGLSSDFLLNLPYLFVSLLR